MEDNMELNEISKQFFKAILDNNYIGISIIDRDGKIIFRNKGVEEITKIKNANVIGKHFSTIPGKGELLKVLETGIPTFGAIYDTKVGTKAVVHRFPLFNKDNEIIGAMSILTFKDTREIEDILEKYHVAKNKLAHYEEELKYLRSAKYNLDNIIGESDQIIYLKNLVKKCAKGNSPVLITGDTGTGKELFAHAIHIESERRNGPFIRINCASIPRDLFESELFGYEPGAFTDASKVGKIGKFELANNGTIFLDEISCLPIEMQSKLLRILQDKEIERIGSIKLKKIDFRLVTATNKSLVLLISEKSFREDLYYRIKVFNVDIPSLKERKEDIPLLCEYIIKSLNEEFGLKIMRIDKKVMEIFLAWHWPGNVRELRNLIERAAFVADSNVIEVEDLPEYISTNKNIINSKDHIKPKNPIQQAKEELEKKLIETTLIKFNWNISRSANELRISRPLLYALIKKYRLKGNITTNDLENT